MQRQVDSYNGPGRSPNNPAVSCADMLDQNPNALSGYYWIGTPRDPRTQYCDMTMSCGGVTGGWTRVAELNMTDSSQQCPIGLKEGTYSDKRTCVMSMAAGCASVIFPVTLDYSKVCGKIIAYQDGTTDAFRRGGHPGIETNYLDGISLTHGNPRHHIWTFAAAAHEFKSDTPSLCPCSNTELASQAWGPPGFVGDNYFCDTGSRQHCSFGLFYGEDPLWDGAGCGPQSTCCSLNNPPWFHRQFPQPTSDNIEMRVCKDEGPSNEDIAIEIVDIFVQ